MIHITSPSARTHPSFAWTITTAILLGLGITMLGMSLIYTQDLNEILLTPNVLWDAICGQPIRKNELILPLLRAIGVMALAGSGAVQFVKNLVIKMQFASS